MASRLLRYALRVIRPHTRFASAVSNSSAPNVVFTLKNVSKVLDNQTVLLKDANVSFLKGSKIGLIGSNGSGKSSLMKIMSGLDRSFTGEAWAAPGVRVGYLAQEPTLDDRKTVLANIMDGTGTTAALLRQFDEISEAMGAEGADIEKLLERQAEIQAQIDACDGWDLQRQVAVAMEALHCPRPEAGVANLSGGERRRVALCRLLIEKPDMLLLDEPTNHLDAASVAWLERFLATYTGTVLAVTHDRYFLDNVADWILEIDRGALFPFRGNYTQWLDYKRRRLDVERKQEAARAKQIDRELEWMRATPNARRSRSKARLVAFEKLYEQHHSQRAAEPGALIIPPGPRLGTQVIEAVGLSKAFPGQPPLFRDLSFRLERGAIVGIVGTNGSGKSTLFRIITGEEKPDAGTLTIGPTVKLGCVAQSRDALNPDNTLYQEVAQGQDTVMVGDTPISVRTYVAQFNFRGTVQEKRVAMLSGGERNRVHLAKLLKGGYNVILLDEPTNDLDVDTLRALEEALPEFPGSAMIISHDRYFLDRVCTHILAFEGDGETVFFEGTYSEYERERKKVKGQTLLEQTRGGSKFARLA